MDNSQSGFSKKIIKIGNVKWKNERYPYASTDDISHYDLTYQPGFGSRRLHGTRHEIRSFLVADTAKGRDGWSTMIWQLCKLPPSSHELIYFTHLSIVYTTSTIALYIFGKIEGRKCSLEDVSAIKEINKREPTLAKMKRRHELYDTCNSRRSWEIWSSVFFCFFSLFWTFYPALNSWSQDRNLNFWIV